MIDIKCVFIQGAGTMGNGIAQASAQAGFEVILMDLSSEFVQGWIFREEGEERVLSLPLI
jgi:3-hydroxyacyl-CoA dehydrogenase